MPLVQFPNTVNADPVASAKSTEAARAGVAQSAVGDPKDRPITPSPAYDRWKDVWALARLVIKGTRGAIEKPEQFIDRWPGEEPDEYAFRAKLAEVFTAYERTCEAMTGLLTLRDPQLSDKLPEQVRNDWKDLDGRGTDGAVFFAECLVNAFPVGMGAWLIDAPHSPTLAQGRTPTIADEQGMRPYWRWYAAEDVLEASTERLPNGREVFSRVRLREVAELPDGKYGKTNETRVRIIERLPVPETAGNGKAARVSYRVVAERMVAGKLDEVTVESGYMTNVSGIPFVPLLLGRREGPCESTLPLEALLWLNRGHYRVTTDMRWNHALASNPTPVMIGEPGATRGHAAHPADPETRDDMQVIGPHRLVRVPLGGDFKYAAAPADSFEAGFKMLEMLLQQMGSVSLNFLQPDARAAETATAHIMDSGAQNASLGLAARRGGAALTLGARYHAEYYGTEIDDDATVTVSRDFAQIPVNPLLLDSLSKMELAGQLSLETLLRVVLHYIRTGGILTDADDLTPEKEQAAIQKQRAAADAQLGDAGGMATRIAGALGRGQGGGADPSADPHAPAPKGDNAGGGA